MPTDHDGRRPDRTTEQIIFDRPVPWEDRDTSVARARVEASTAREAFTAADILPVPLNGNWKSGTPVRTQAPHIGLTYDDLVVLATDHDAEIIITISEYGVVDHDGVVVYAAQLADFLSALTDHNGYTLVDVIPYHVHADTLDLNRENTPTGESGTGIETRLGRVEADVDTDTHHEAADDLYHLSFV